MKLYDDMVKTEELCYKNFGKCVKLTNGVIELIVTLEVGPRIIRFSAVGGENIFFEDNERTINHNNQKEIYAELYGEDLKPWAILGGHRIWTSPEAFPRSYVPDYESEYEPIENGIKVVSPVQSWTQLQPEVEITIIGENEVKVVHRLKNCGAWPIEFSVWALSVCDTGSTLFVPQSSRKVEISRRSEVLHNRTLTLWEYSNMADERVTWGKKYIALRQDKNVLQPFKFGINNEDGYAICFNHGNMFVKKYDTVLFGNYPDGGSSSFEAYTNGALLEVESIGELKKIESGDMNEHTEYWKLFTGISVPQSEDEVDEIVAKYV